MKKRPDPQQRQKRRNLAKNTLWLLPLLAAWGAQRFFSVRPQLGESLQAGVIFPALATPIGYLSSLWSGSVTELALGLFLGLGLPWSIWRFVCFIRRPAGRKARAGKLARRLAWILSISYAVFMLLHGLNFTRLPLAESFNLEPQPRTAADLAATSEWLVTQTNLLRAERPQDEAGVFTSERSMRELFATTHEGYDLAAQDYPQLSGFAVRPKPVLLSHYWSYTGISGMYFPFFVEANVNVGPPHFQVLDSALHEIAHVRGFAREDEANFLAFLAGTYHPDSDYAYAAMLAATRRCLNALYGSDRERHAELLEKLSDGARRDLAASRTYWQQFEGPVQEASTSVNHAFLQANLQEDGVRSYGRVVDLILAYWWQAQEQGELERIEQRLDASLKGSR